MKTLGYVLLELLVRGSYSGYDLTQILKQRIAYFWQAGHSQIYPELARLEAENLVTFEVVAQEDRPDKKIYSITEAGRALLREWVTTPTDSFPPKRDELVLKAYCLWLGDPERAIKLFEDQAQQHTKQLADYRKAQAWIEQQWDQEGRRIDSQWFGSYISLQRGIGNEREYADWCHWVIEQIKQGQTGP
jgi:DNA-binding PadR family transcriptional regulator